jgi:hypothetical protein
MLSIVYGFSSSLSCFHKVSNRSLSSQFPEHSTTQFFQAFTTTNSQKTIIKISLLLKIRRITFYKYQYLKRSQNTQENNSIQSLFQNSVWYHSYTTRRPIFSSSISLRFFFKHLPYPFSCQLQILQPQGQLPQCPVPIFLL